MSTSSRSPSSVHPCRWDWCREMFDTADRLAKHVLDAHVAKEVPVKREEIRIELRAFNGTSIGDDSIRTTLLMNENAFLDDEEKENDAPDASNRCASRSPIRQGTLLNGEDQERRIGDISSTFPQNEQPDSPLLEPETFVSGHAQPPTIPTRPFHTPSPSPARNGFQALAAASSCSPDPSSMTVAPSPSIAEMLANTLNIVHRSNGEGLAGPSFLGSGQSKPPSTGGPARSSRPSSSHGKRKSAELQLQDRPASRSRTRTSSNASHKHTAQEVPTLPPISEVVGLSGSQNGIHTEAQSSGVATFSARPFRTGSIRLEANSLPPPKTTDDISPRPLHDSTSPHPDIQVQPEPQGTSAPPAELYQATTNTLMDDMDILSSSLDHSIPAFTQGVDVENQSQWPLATQAPYSLDSQLTFSSQ